MADLNNTSISLCIQILTDFLEDNCDPEEKVEEVYPDIYQARQILIEGQNESSSMPVVSQAPNVSGSHSAVYQLTSNVLSEYAGFENISQKALAEEITSDQKFDQLLDELEFRFSDDTIDRKRLLAALQRKTDALEAFISQE